MKILLINPPLLMAERSNLTVAPHIQEPLGLAYLAAAVRQGRPQDQIEILDCQVLGYSVDDLKSYFSANTFDVVGFTVPTLAFYNAQKTAQLVKQFFDATIIFGGPHPTSLPEETLQEVAEADIVVIDEAEATIVELLNALEKGTELTEVRGIAFRQADETVVTPPRPYIEDLDSIPMPARDLLAMRKYSPSPTFFQRLPAYSIIDARGCPCRCTFCATLFGQSVRSHSKERICAEIELLIKDHGARCIIFRSDTFTISRARTEELCHEFIRRGLNKKISWHCQSRINTVTPELLKLMASAGCEGIHYGVESGNSRLLKVLNKGIRLEDVPQVFKWTRQAGITGCAYFMIGIPGETREETLKTIEFSRNCGADFASFSIFTPYPGSDLFDRIKSEGKLKTTDWRNFSSDLSFSQRVTPYVPEGRDENDLKELHRRAVLGFYLRPVTIVRQLRNIKSFGRFLTLTKGFFYLLKVRLIQILQQQKNYRTEK